MQHWHAALWLFRYHCADFAFNVCGVCVYMGLIISVGFQQKRFHSSSPSRTFSSVTSAGYQQPPLSAWRFRLLSARQYKRSVSYLEYKSQEVWTPAKGRRGMGGGGGGGALWRRMAIEMSQKNAREIKRRMSSAVQSTPSTPVPTHPCKSARNHLS